MTANRVRKSTRPVTRSDDVSDLHAQDVNTVHDTTSNENVHSVHTGHPTACDKAREMPPDTATKLRQLRTARRLSQVEVAAAVGVDRSMISKMEKGTPGSRETVIKLAEYYGVSIDWLVDETGGTSPKQPSALTGTEAQLIEYFRSLPQDVAEAFLKSIQAAAAKR